MKKKLLSALSLLMLYFGSMAQTNIANYTFTASTGAYTPLTGATTFTNSWDDIVSSAIPLGGTFVFGGVSYTTCFINSNGYLTFGAAESASNYAPISTVNSSSAAICGFACDGASSTFSASAPLISYANVASEFIVEFKDHATYGGRASEMVNFQIRLNLTTNQIKIVYGSFTAPAATTYPPQVGLRGNTVTWTTNVNSLLIGNVPAANTCNWSNIVTSNANSSTLIFSTVNTNVVPSNGLTYAWDVPAVSIAPVRAFNAVSGINTTSAIIGWTAPTGATQYNVQYRVQGNCGWTNFTGNPVSAVTASLTGLNPSTIYQIRVQSSNGTNNAIWSHIPNSTGTASGYVAAGTFSTMALCPAPTALNVGTIAATTANYTWTAGGTETSWDLYFGPQPLAAPVASTVPSATNSSTLFPATGLTPSTGYAVYVRANCGGPNGVSLWTAVKNFTTLASCQMPTALNVSSITATTANYTWTAGGTETSWDLYFGPQPLAAPVASTVPSAASASTLYPATSLTPNTAYAVYIRANCGGPSGVSAWTAVKTFTTNCNNTALPFTEGFNSTTIPTCWTQQYVVGASNLQFVASSSNPVTTPFEGTDYVMWNGYSITGGNETRLVSPPITTTGTFSVDVNFRWFNENSTFYNSGAYLNEGVQVQYSLDGVTWNNVQFFARYDASLPSGTGAWNFKNLTLPAAAANKPTVFIGFKFHSEFGDNCSLDKVNVLATPACTQAPVAGTITGTNTLNVFGSGNYTISPAVGNLQWYTTTSPTSTLLAGITNGTASTISYTAASAGTVYLTVIASNPGCPNDTANVPFQVIVNPLPGDMACSPITLTVGPSTAYYKLVGMGVQTGEVAPPPTGCSVNNGWCNATLNNTRWFSFVAPASGNVSVQSPGFDTQLAVWSATNCSALTNTTSPATLIAANDDDSQASAHGGVSYSSYVRALCLTPGATYYIQLDSYGTISSSDSTKVEIINLGANTFTSLATSYCQSASSVSLTPNIPGGVFTLNTNTTSISVFTPSLASVGSNTVYYNAFGCISNSVTTIIASPTISALSSPSVICSGSTTSITASGANTYTWSTSSTNTTIAVTPTANTTYTVVGTTGACSNTAIVTVTVNAIPVVIISGTTSICNGQAFAIAASGATTYSWSTSATTSTLSASPSANTNYTVTGTSNNCSSTATVAITVNPHPTITVSNGTICAGSSFTLSPSGASTYSYSTGPVVTPTANTSYSVTGTSSVGCASSNTAVATVSVNALPSVSLGVSNGTLCTTSTGGSTVSLTGSPSGGVYTGTNVAGNVFTPATSGTFTPAYSFTNSTTGCAGTATTSIVVSVCTGINNKTTTSLTGLLVYPNPNTGEFTVELNNGSTKNIQVLDVTGRIVLSDASANDKMNFNINNLANGVYYVKIQSNNTVEVLKIVKQ